MKLMKYEFYHLCRDRAVWAAWAALIAFGLLMAYLGRRNFTGTPVESMVPLILSNPFLSMWAGVVLAPVFFGLDFQNRTLNIAVCLGYKRINIFMAKAFWYYLYGVSALFISTVCTVWISYGAIVPMETLAEIFRVRLAQLILIYCATLTVPVVFIFAFRDMFVSTAINVILTYTVQRLMENERVSDLLSLYPPYIQLNIMSWSTWPGIPGIFLTGVLYVVTGFAICFYIFRARELK